MNFHEHIFFLALFLAHGAWPAAEWWPLHGFPPGQGSPWEATKHACTSSHSWRACTRQRFWWNKMVLCQALPLVLLVGLLASFASGEETTIASTSAEPFWLGKDCVRNEDGEWRLRSRFAYIWLKNSTSVFKILNSLKMLPRHEKKVPHESLLYLEQIALSKVHFSGTVRDAAGEEDPNTVVSRKPFHFQFSVALDWIPSFGFWIFRCSLAKKRSLVAQRIWSLLVAR